MMKRPMLVPTLLVASAATIVAASGCAGKEDASSPTGVVRAYFNAVTSGDCATAKKYTAPSAVDPDRLCRSLAGTVVTNIGPATSIDSNTEIVPVTTKDKPPQTNPTQSVQLVRVDQAWLIKEIATTV